MTKPLLRAAADGSWESTLAMEEFAEPQCFTTGAFQEAVRGLLAGAMSGPPATAHAVATGSTPAALRIADASLRRRAARRCSAASRPCR